MINNSEFNKRMQYACIAIIHYHISSHSRFIICLYIELLQTYYDILKIKKWKNIALRTIRILDNIYDQANDIIYDRFLSSRFNLN